MFESHNDNVEELKKATENKKNSRKIKYKKYEESVHRNDN